MPRTLPIPAEQPLDAAWKAAGQVGAEAVAVQAVAMRAAASITLAAVLWPSISAAHAVAGVASALGPWLPPRPLPEQQVVVAMPGSGGAARGAKLPGGPSGAARAAAAITLGIEEEFVLLDPSTGVTVLAGPDLVRMLDGEPGVQQELMQFQVETGTRVCSGLDDLGGELVRLRRLAAAAAARLGCRLVASGVAPYRTSGLAALTRQPRYQELARRYGPVVAEAGICACHVHVGVPSRDLGVQVLARLRPWLAPLLALTANSPIADGHDTGWASWRYTIQSRWPTAVPPAVWPDAAAYDTAVGRLIGRGAALDERSVYFLARLSPRYPTVEVRVADVCLDAGTAVLLAGLTRALVATALAEARRGTPPAAAPARQVAAALAGAARQGLAGAGVDPFTGRAVDAAALRSRLLDHVYPALRDGGDTETITRLLHRLDQRGTGADRQRALFTSAASTPAFITALARATLAGYEPAPLAPGPMPGSRRLRQGQDLAGDDAYRRRERHSEAPQADDLAAAGRPYAHRPARARGPRGPARAGVDDQPQRRPGHRPVLRPAGQCPPGRARRVGRGARHHAGRGTSPGQQDDHDRRYG
ncbi:MAG: glutamate--cysteine ligase [Streptosporangiaceae bacterium]